MPVLTQEEKEQVFIAAQTIFSEMPVSKVSLKDIADASNVNVKKITSDYEDSQTLLHSILVEGIEDTTKLFIRMVDARGKADIKLIRLVRELLRRYQRHSPLFRLTSINFQTLSEIDLEMHNVMTFEDLERYRQNSAIIARIIAQGQSEGLFVKDVDPLEAAYLLRGMISNAIQYWQLLKKEEPLDAHADIVTRVFLKGVYK